MYIKSRQCLISWSKINLFLNCKRCFYKDQRLGIRRPGPEAENFKLNKAIDTLLKNEFDQYRSLQKIHPIMVEHGIDALPFKHNSLKAWQDPYRAGGVRFYHSSTDMVVFGGLDDLWVNPAGELIIVEYKATATTGLITLDNKNQWHREYMRQISFYAWLFKNNNYKVCPTSYFIFCNGVVGNSFFKNRLKFDCVLLQYAIDVSWIEQTLQNLRSCLDQESMPSATFGCKFCEFTRTINLSMVVQ